MAEHVDLQLEVFHLIAFVQSEQFHQYAPFQQTHARIVHAKMVVHALKLMAIVIVARARLSIQECFVKQKCECVAVY